MGRGCLGLLPRSPLLLRLAPGQLFPSLGTVADTASGEFGYPKGTEGAMLIWEAL